MSKKHLEYIKLIFFYKQVYSEYLYIKYMYKNKGSKIRIIKVKK